MLDRAGQLLLRKTAIWLLAAIVYVIAGKIGLALAYINPSTSAVWPPTGIALAFVLIFGRAVWPSIFAGAFIVNYDAGSPVPVALAIAAGNTGEALFGGLLTVRFAGGRAAFTRSQGLFAFVLLAGLVSTMISATVGVTSLALSGAVGLPQYGSVWLTWWLGNAAGAVTVTPLLVLWAAQLRVRWSLRQWVEAAALGLALLGVAWIVFVESSYPVEFLTIPLCVWAGARFGPREAATATGILSALAVWATVRGAGPFGGLPLDTALLLTQLFMVVAQIAGLGIGTALAELHDAHGHVRRLNEELEHRVASRTAELYASEARLVEAQEVAHVGSWEWDVAGDQVWWSDELYRFWGVTRDAFHPTYATFLAAVHAEDVARVRTTIEESSVEGRPFEIEYRIRPAHRSERIVMSRGRVVRNAAGETIRMIGTAQDVTEQRQLETRVQQAQKLEALGLLSGGIAHDFNNLITAIGGYTELVLQSVDSADPRHADLLEVRKASDRAAALTRRLLAFSRTQPLQPRLVDVNGVVAGIENLLRRTIGEHIDLRLELDPHLEPVRLDVGQFEQVLLNMALNARDAMPEGGELRFTTAPETVTESWARQHPPMAAGRYTRLTVSDTGIGMPPEIQSRIFEPFFTTKPPGQGTGFGLATAYGIIKQSGGFIWVSSEVGRGTAFDIYLPALPHSADRADEKRRTTAAAGGTETILLVEDDGAVRRLAGTVLSEAGYTVVPGRDGEEALAIARGHPTAIDLVITDVVMPGISGRELAHRLRATHPGLRVLYTSGYARTGTVSVGIDASAPFLAKPFLPAELLAKVREVLNGPAFDVLMHR